MALAGKGFPPAIKHDQNLQDEPSNLKPGQEKGQTISKRSLSDLGDKNTFHWSSTGRGTKIFEEIRV